MPSKKKAPKTASPPTSLKGWQQISAFLGQRVNVAQRWAKSGMPIVRDGRSITATPADLNSWLAREAGGEPLHVSTERDDLSADLKRGLAYLKTAKKKNQRS
jgi:phage terminase Nu1 subunit (DNA packaging protein)